MREWGVREWCVGVGREEVVCGSDDVMECGVTSSAWHVLER